PLHQRDLHPAAGEQVGEGRPGGPRPDDDDASDHHNVPLRPWDDKGQGGVNDTESILRGPPSVDLAVSPRPAARATPDRFALDATAGSAEPPQPLNANPAEPAVTGGLRRIAIVPLAGQRRRTTAPFRGTPAPGTPLQTPLAR